MTLATHPPESDLWIPKPDGAIWNPHTIHTHYFGIAVPDAAIGGMLYLRWMPVFNLLQAGVMIYQGTNNIHFLDVEHQDYQMTMPWADFEDGVVTTANGLQLAVEKPGERLRLTYRSADGSTSFELVKTGVSPLVTRSHVMPGEEVDTDPSQEPGGLEQFMHCVGELNLNGKRYDVDFFPIRDRSWRQVRSERVLPYPPAAWSPMCFGDDLMFNQAGWESLDTDPAWAGLYDPPTADSHYFGWVWTGDDGHRLAKVRRNVTKRHPDLFAATEQDIEVEDQGGNTYRFHGEVVAMAHLPTWPNSFFVDSVYRWQDETGRETFCTYQEVWSHRYHRAMSEKRRNR